MTRAPFRFRLLALSTVAVSALAGLALAQTPPRQGPAASAAAQGPTPAARADAAALAAPAVAAIEARCATCHQSGRTSWPPDRGGPSNILDLARVAADPTLVRPGVPDSSPFYTAMVGAHPTALAGSQPTSAEIAVVARWIAALPPSDAACGGRSRLLPVDVARLLAQAQVAAGDRARQLRFVSLAPLWNACVPDAEVATYAQGVGRLFNSLSWSEKPVRLSAVDPQGLVIAVPLDAIGWVGAHWELIASKIATVSQAARIPALAMPEDVRTAAGTSVPVLAADAVAAAIADAAVYTELMGLPGRRVQLEKLLGADVDGNIRSGKARRAGIKDPVETRNNRIVERHPATAGAYWLTYDTLTEAGRQNVTETPLGPVTPTSGQGAGEIARGSFRHDGSEVLHHLPNGFVAFSVFDSHGERLEHLPAETAPERASAAPARTGIACLSCHATGPLPALDDVRAAIEPDRRMPRETREAVLSLYPPRGEFTALVDDDAGRVRAAHVAAGLDPDQRVRGLEPVNALVALHAGPADLTRAAAEFGLPDDRFRERLDRVISELKPAARRLRQGLVSRSELDALLAAIAGQPDGPPGAPTPPVAAQTTGAPAARADRLRLSLWSERDSYTAGETATFYAATNAPCLLTLVSVDTTGRAIVLLPSDVDGDNQLQPGRELQVPSVDAPYRLRVKTPGRETIVGICSTTRKTAVGIEPDYEQQRFTILGDWRPFDAASHGSDVDPTRARPRVESRGGPARRRSRPADTPAPAAAEEIARAAITYEVK